MDFKDSKTFQNLQKAYEGELLSSGKYAIYGKKAKSDGYEQIGNVFNTASNNEIQHAEVWLKLLNNGLVPDTLTNLKESTMEENYLWRGSLNEFAKTAREEGYEDIANLFENVTIIERNQDYLFDHLAANIENSQVFCKPQAVLWICTICGYIVYDMCAPFVCPVCGYPQGYFQVYQEIE